MRRIVKVFGLITVIIFLCGQIAYAGIPFNPINGLKSLGSGISRVGRDTFKAGRGLVGGIPGSGLVRGAASVGRWHFNNVIKPAYKNTIQRPTSTVFNQGIRPAAGWVRHNAGTIAGVTVVSSHLGLVAKGAPVGVVGYNNHDTLVKAARGVLGSGVAQGAGSMGNGLVTRAAKGFLHLFTGKITSIQ